MSSGQAHVVSGAISGYHQPMREESRLIPYAVASLESSPIIILAPHPDDEIFGCSAILVEGLRWGAEINTVILTGGGDQGDPSQRMEESREAARRMGVPEPEFWDFSDRCLDPQDTKLLGRIEDKLRLIRPALVVLPSPAEIHPDHRAVALAGWKVIRKVLREEPACLPADFRLLACEISAPLRPNLLVDLSDSWKKVCEAARVFESQNQVRPYLDVFESMARIRCLSLPDSVTRAAGYFAVNRDFILNENVRDWAAAQGPSLGLEEDDPELMSPQTQALRGFFARLFGRGGDDA